MYEQIRSSPAVGSLCEQVFVRQHVEMSQTDRASSAFEKLVDAMPTQDAQSDVSFACIAVALLNAAPHHLQP